MCRVITSGVNEAELPLLEGSTETLRTLALEEITAAEYTEQ